MILFLDFDGVLHAASNHANSQEQFKRLPLLENWLRAHLDVDIVISSSWREDLEFEALVQLFSEDLRHRVIGKCPIILLTEDMNYYRFEEIKSWLKLEKYDGLWLALDDATHEFPPYFDKVVVCQKNIGIDDMYLLLGTDGFWDVRG